MRTIAQSDNISSYHYTYFFRETFKLNYETNSSKSFDQKVKSLTTFQYEIKSHESNFIHNRVIGSVTSYRISDGSSISDKRQVQQEKYVIFFKYHVQKQNLT